MGSRPSIIYEVLALLDSQMAIGQSRHQAKQEARQAVPDASWPAVTEKIYSYGTRKTYQQQVLAFVNWARTHFGIRQLARLYERLDELASRYLKEQIDAGKSTYTVLTQRAALRKVFRNRLLADDIVIPQRKREDITRSRLPVEHDKHFQPTNWQAHILFAQATGLRRAELRDVSVGEVFFTESGTESGQLMVFVRNGKGGKARIVPVLAGYEDMVWALVKGRDPKEHVFAHIPKDMDVQSYRRASAQERYLSYASERALPPPNKRLKPADYDADATRQVSRALGHERKSIVLTHYLR